MRTITFKHVELYDPNSITPRLIFKGIIREVTEYWHPDGHGGYWASISYMTDAYSYDEQEDVKKI
jgi:hypothetical protein